MATASWSVSPLEPFDASTPITSKLVDPIMIVAPRGFSPVVNRLLATSDPMSTTWAWDVTSWLEIALPAWTV